MSKKPPNHRIRKLRTGVTIDFYGYNHDGIPQWIIHDTGRDKFFIIGWPEYEMLSRWNLGNREAIIDAVNNETTLHVTEDDFENLRNFLNTNYLVELRWLNVYQKAKEQKVIKGENIGYWFIRYYLFFRIPLFHLDNFLNRTKFIGDILFSNITLFVMTILGITALFEISNHWEEFKHTFSTIFNFQGLIFYFIAFTIAKFFHELGHAYMCKRYGIPVPTMGVAFLVFWPVMYTDTTLSWKLPYHQRLKIALAGMWVETYVTIIAALIWANTHNVIIHMICYVTVAVNWVSTLLINVSPFMRFDGYYVLSDLLKMPNLQNRSFALARWQIRKWLFGWEEPATEHYSTRMHRILVVYAFLTWTYRLIIYFGIALIVYHYFFKAAGIILFLIEIYVFILRPIYHELLRWYSLRAQFTLNTRTKISITAFIILLFLLFFPLNPSIQLNATLSYSHIVLYAPMDSILETPLPKQGTLVQENQPIVTLRSDEVQYNLIKSQLEYEKIQVEIRRASLNPSFYSEKSNLEAEASEKKAEYDKWFNLQQKLILNVPFNGIISDVAMNVTPGLPLKKGQWVLDVVDPSKQVIEAYVNESDIEEIKTTRSGYFYPNNTDLPIIPVKLLAIEPINAADLSVRYTKELSVSNKEEYIVATPSYNASVLGGNIPTEVTEEGKYVPVESVFRVLLSPEKTIDLKNIQLGSVKLYAKARPFIFNVFYKIKSSLVKESEF